MKPSRFNVLFAAGDDAHLYNTRRGSYLRFPDTPADHLAALTPPGRITVAPGGEPRPIDPSAVDPTLLQALVEGDFLVPADLDELALLQAANRIARFGPESLNLTILTTLGCNLDCIYCYEDKQRGVMKAAVQDRIVDFVSRQAPRVKQLGVTWFGGEPLLGLGLIERLSTAFLALTAQHGIGYGADIITNGYLLTRPVAEKLAAWGVAAAQITLDGVPAVHDSRRPRAGGRPSFDVIFANIQATCDLIGITIRMNLDADNAPAARALIDYLAAHDLQGKVWLSFAPVHSEGKGCRDRNDGCKTNLFGLRAFSKLQIDLHRYALAQGFPFDSLPRSRAHACCADHVQGYVIEPDGNLQKCWQTVSDAQERIGDVRTGTPLGPNLLKWLNYDPFALDKCRACKVLPLCMGWCPQKIMADPSPESCSFIRHTLIEELRLFYSTHSRQQAALTGKKAGCGH